MAGIFYQSTVYRTCQTFSLLRTLAGARKGDSVSKRAAHKRIADRLGKLKGFFQKFGQLAAGADGGELNGENSYAAMNDPLPAREIVKVLVRAWDSPLHKAVSHFSGDGIAASIGQVHRARTIAGRDIAIKIQYPGIARVVKSDLKLMMLMMRGMNAFGFGFDAAGLRGELTASIGGELDYHTEADNQRRYRQYVALQRSDVVVPEVHPSLVRRNVLVSDWVDSSSLAVVCRDWTFAQRRRAGEILLHHVLDMLLTYGFVHGDLHPGNIGFRLNRGAPEVVLYDFGSIYRCKASHRLALRALLGNPAAACANPHAALTALDFNPDLLHPIQSVLAPFLTAMLEPFSGRDFDLRVWDLARRSRETLGEGRWNFRAAAPASLLFLVRVVHGLVQLLRALHPAIDWREPIQRICAVAGDAPTIVNAPAVVAHSNKRLRLEVWRDGASRVKLLLPITVLEQPDVWLSTELRERIVRRGIDIDSILKNSVAQHYPAGTLFDVDDDQSRVRVIVEDSAVC